MPIELRHVSKHYDQETVVLSDLNFRVNEGELFVIIGPSGCGKSTLLRMIAGLIPISSGELLINGEVANDRPPKDRGLSMVFQSYALYPFLTVRDNVAFGLKSRKVAPEAIKEQVDHALDLVHLTEFADRKPRQLSGGQRQRVALARAIASQAKLCLMDEPLSNLDAQLRVQMRAEIRRLQQKLGLTIIYVTHDQIEAMTMADRVLVLNQSKVQQLDSPRRIYHQPANEFVASFFGTPQINLLPARLGHQGLAVDDYLHQAVDRPLDLRHRYRLGLRAQDLTIASGDVGHHNAIIRAREYWGSQLIVRAEHQSGTLIQVAASPDLTAAVGDPVIIRASRPGLIFDDSDRRLAAHGEVVKNDER